MENKNINFVINVYGVDGAEAKEQTVKAVTVSLDEDKLWEEFGGLSFNEEDATSATRAEIEIKGKILADLRQRLDVLVTDLRGLGLAVIFDGHDYSPMEFRD